MNKFPIPVLSLILTTIGPFPEICRLKLVCKTWSKAIENSYLIVTFQRSAQRRLQPGNFDRLICDVLSEKFLNNSTKKPLKLESLDLRNVTIDAKALADLIFSQPWLLKLNLINNNINFESLWKLLYRNATKILGKQAHYKHSLEELKVSNHSSYTKIGYEYIAQTFTNLKKLYAGNTNTSLKELYLLWNR